MLQVHVISGRSTSLPLMSHLWSSSRCCHCQLLLIDNALVPVPKLTNMLKSAGQATVTMDKMLLDCVSGCFCNRVHWDLWIAIGRELQMVGAASIIPDAQTSLQLGVGSSWRSEVGELCSCSSCLAGGH